MKIILNTLLFTCLLSLLGFQYTKAQKNEMNLWYNKPGEVWTDALPVGNGRLGAMIYGKTENEIIQFNEETLWSGQPHDYTNKGASKYLPELRELLFEGKQAEAHKLGNDHFMSNPIGQQCYLPFGEVHMVFHDHKNATNYYRALDLNEAIAKVSYHKGGVNFSRESFASHPDEAIIIHLKADKAKALNFSVSLSTPHSQHSTNIEKNLIILSGKANNYQVRTSSEKSRAIDE